MVHIRFHFHNSGNRKVPSNFITWTRLLDFQTFHLWFGSWFICCTSLWFGIRAYEMVKLARTEIPSWIFICRKRLLISWISLLLWFWLFLRQRHRTFLFQIRIPHHWIFCWHIILISFITFWWLLIILTLAPPARGPVQKQARLIIFKRLLILLVSILFTFLLADNYFLLFF